MLNPPPLFFSGRGRQPQQSPSDFGTAMNVTSNDNQYFLRSAGQNGLDAVAFHYSIYRSFQRFLGLDGNLQVGYDTPVNFVDAWSTLFVTNDLINPSTGEIDPRHMMGMSNFDILRWDGLVSGTQKSALGIFIASLVMPGSPLVSFLAFPRFKLTANGPSQIYYGEEQGLYLFDNTASNYLFG
jgi:alpha-1,3-glucan synthase